MNREELKEENRNNSRRSIQESYLNLKKVNLTKIDSHKKTFRHCKHSKRQH